jgi:starch phosphorylase
MYSNPQLTKLLEETIGNEFKSHPEKLEDLMDYVDDPIVQDRFMQVKRERKQILAKYVKDTLGIDVNVDSIFDCQAKRLHAYKRQLLNIFAVMHLYMRMKKDPNFRIYPRTFFFSAKAAPSYELAKEIIKLINIVAEKVNADPETNELLKVVFIPNYSVSVAEILLNAADVSEQISTAGKEASGTGNMKYMMNGALTLGTLDGANVEIVEQVGEENAQIFGLRVEDINWIKHENSYSSWNYYSEHENIREVVDSLRNGYWSSNMDEFRLIYNDLMTKNDEFFVMADFNSYLDAQGKVEARYRDTHKWARTMLINIAKSGYFSSDRTILEYSRDIWHLDRIQFDN